MKRKKKREMLKCINGVKGAISLFLAVLMTPFLTIALLLVEAGRYNSSVSLIDEAMGVSSYSVLADYDSYLLKRWGVLGVSQDMDMSQKFSNYMTVNSSVGGKALTWSNPTIEGIYPLSDTAILQNQIMEYSKLNVPTQLSSRLFSVFGDMFGNLNKPATMVDIMDKITGFTKTADSAVQTLTAGVKILDGGIQLVDSAETMKESANKLDQLAVEYNNAYDSFSTNVNNLIYWYAEKANVETLLTTKQSELQQLEQELEKLENANKTTSDESNVEADDSSDKDDEAIEDLKERIPDIETEIRNLNSRLRTAESNISTYKGTSKTAKTDYATKIGEVAQELTTFRNAASTAMNAIQDVSKNVIGGIQSGIQTTLNYKQLTSSLEEKQKNLEAAEKELEKWEDNGQSTNDPAYIAGLEMKISLEEEVNSLQEELAPLQTQISIAEGGKKALEGMNENFSTRFEDYDEAVITEIINGFNSLKVKVSNVTIDSIDKNSAPITAESYHNISVSGYIASDEIEEFLKQEEEKLKGGSLSAIMDALMSVYNSIMGMSVFVEDDLAACLNLSYYEQNFGGLPGGTDTTGDVIELVRALGDATADTAAFYLHFQTFQLWKILNDLKEISNSYKRLLIAMGEFVLTLLYNITEAGKGYDRWYLTTYCTYNLSCRTDFNAASDKMIFKNMSGQTFSEDSFPDKNSGFSVPLFGEIAVLVETLVTNITGTGEDLTFNGAELEYVLFGSTNEAVNQLYVFCLLYIIRVLECIPMISANVEIQGLAAASTFGYPVVMALYYIFEPLVQVALLCNGKSQPLFPTKAYLSPTGLPDLLKELVFFCKFTNKQKDEIKTNMIKAFGTTEEELDLQSDLFEGTDPATYDAKKLFNFSYRDFCMLLLLVTVRKERMLERLMNVMQMETMYYYQTQKAEFTFDLKKSFTYLHTTVDVKVGQIMPDLLEAALFSTTREQYRGY